MMRYWFAQEIIQRFAGSLLHFLWQGVVVALIAAIFLRLLKKRSAETRYAVSIAALMAMLAAPVITFVFYAQTGALTLKVLLWAGTIIHAHGLVRPAASDTAAWTRWIVVVWAVGAFVFTIRLMMSWRLSRTLIGASEAVPYFVLQVFEGIKQRIVQNKAVRLLANAQIDTPIVVGCFRPVVLLPLTAITGLQEDHLMAVLAHELAHIRRHDFLLNILQRGVESILFYHPAVWWLSGRIRDEREHCCDDVAVRICGDRRLYVKALLDLESKRSEDPGLAVAAVGGSLVHRSRRILGLESPRCDWQAAMAPLLFMVVWMAAGIWQSTVMDARPRVAPIPMPPVLAAIPVMPGLGVEPVRLSKAIGVIAAIVTAQPVVAEPPPGVSAAAEVQKVDTGSIRGTVTHPGTTDGIAEVDVTIRGNGRATSGPYNLKTDASGRFTVNDVPAGAWVVSAVRDGYLPSGGTSGGTSTEQVLANVTPQNQSSVTLHLIAAGTIRGRITNSNGAPISGAMVEPVIPGYDNSGRRAWLPKTGTPRGVTTDDHGEYRVYSCWPGDYYVRVLQLNRVDAVRSVVSYFPGSGDPALAMPVTVREGVDSTADIVLPLLVTRKVSGNIHVDRAATDKLRLTVYATLRDRRIPAEPLRISSQIAGSDGSFSFAGVQPGSYDIRADAGSPLAFTGRLTLDVGERDVSGIALSLHPIANITAHVSSAGGAPIANILLRMVSMDADAVSSVFPLQRSSVSGDFRISNVVDGLYVFRESGVNRNMVVSDIRQGPRSVIETGLSIGANPPQPLEVTISTETGTVQGNTDVPAGASSATVVLVPEIPHRQNMLLYKSIRADSSGHFTINSVAPGRYDLFAWESNLLSGAQLTDAAMNAEFLSQYEARGVNVTVSAGAAVTSPKVSLIRNLVFPPIPPSNIPALTAAPAGEPTGAVLEGIVTRSGTVEPVAGATVTAAGAKSFTAVADANGRFRIAGVPADTYRIRAERDGYLPTLYPQQLSKNVSQDQHVDGIVVSIRLGGAINGRLLGPDGKPLARTPVVAGSTIPSDTARYPKSGTTNDRGEFRIFGLEPGTYIVGVNAQQGTAGFPNTRSAYVRTYFPNTADLFRAVPVDVAEGANITNIDFTVQQVPTVRISGKVINSLAPASNSATASPAEIQLIPQESSPLDTGSSPGQQIRVPPDGMFTIPNVAPGTYYVVAVGSGSGSNVERPKAWTTVRVGQQDISDVNLTIQPGMKVTGRLVGGDRFSAIFGTLRLFASGAPINLQAQMLLSQTAVIDDTGAFTVSNVPAGNYRLVMQSGARNQFISDVRIGAASVLRNGLTVENNAPLDGLVVALGGAGTLVGTVLNAQGIGASAVTVVLQPDPQRSADATLYKTATSSTSGRFTITDVPPGNYTVLAFQGFSVDPARSAPLLEEFATSGQPVTVDPDAGTSVTVTLIPRLIP